MDEWLVNSPLKPTNKMGRLQYEREGDAVTAHDSGQQDVAQLPAGRPDHRSVVVLDEHADNE